MPSVVVSLGIGVLFEMLGIERSSVELRARRPPHVDVAVRAPDHVRGVQPLRQTLRGSGPGSRRHTLSDRAPRRPADRPPSLVGVGLFGFTLSYDELARSSQALGASNTLPLELQAMQTNDHAGDLRAGHADHRLVAGGDRHQPHHPLVAARAAGGKGLRRRQGNGLTLSSWPRAAPNRAAATPRLQPSLE